MAIYKDRNDSLFLDELHLYGSNRLGVIKEQQFLTKKLTGGTPPPPQITPVYTLKLYNFGKKRYELTDWLGNVRVVINDKKTPQGTNPSDMTYQAQTISVSDYYPFGMLARNYNVDKYRFGFGGHEKINEVYGVENVVDMGDRWLDVRLGRTTKSDRKAKKYPDVSPYSYAANNPILFIDPDGKVVKAYSVESQTLVIKTLNYAFGQGHGFSFQNNTLVHNGEPPKNMTPQQTLMFNYIIETLVKSQTVTTVKTNQNLFIKRNSDGELMSSGAVEEGNAATLYFPATKTYKDNGKFRAPTIISSTEAENQILVTSGLLKKGINLETEKGDKIFGSEHALLHEFAHAMVNVIMNEMGGKFNGVDFNDMSEQERSDWAIQFTNTLLQSKNQPLETGKGQHGRNKDETPDKKAVAPLTK